MEKITLRHSSGATAEVYHHGAHVTSWKTASGKELMFVSKDAIFKPPKAIRGGVPVCFPQFNDMGSGPAHGFARNSTWTVVDAPGPEGSKATLSFKPSEEQLQSYPHDFELTMVVDLGEHELTQTMTVKNTGSSSMAFTTALHTYLRVSDIANVSVEGLGGLSYLDNLQNRITLKEEADPVRISKEVDRIYLNTPGAITIVDEGSGRFTVEKTNLPDAVLWNPWIDKAKSMADYGDEEYHEMVCLEPAKAGSGPQELAAGGTWSCVQKLRWSEANKGRPCALA